ncbi:hypothetical protein PV326_009921 [Microctonus aethiopoides]|nr:hypothetical protein PV326_009921 [Microctonus aethiopoides]
MNYLINAQQMQKSPNENLKNICDMLSQSLKNTMNASRIDLKHSSCLFTRMERMISRTLRVIRMRNSNRIDMNNVRKITYNVDNNDSSLSPKTNTKYEPNLTQEENISDEVESDVEEEMIEQIPHSNDNVSDKMKSINTNCDPKQNSLNFEEMQIEQNDSCDIDEDENVHENKSNDSLEMIVDDLDTSSSSSSDNFSDQYDSDSDMTSNSDVIPTSKQSQNDQSTISKDVPGKSFNSSLQFPEDFSPTLTKFRTRTLSETSSTSDGSSFIVFDSDAESDAENSCTEESDNEESMCNKEADSDDDSFIVFDNDAESNAESSDSEESENEENDDDNTEPKVRFNLKPKIHLMINWAFAYRAARKGNWAQIFADRKRFENRINETAKTLEPIFIPKHREHIYQTRFIAQE